MIVDIDISVVAVVAVVVVVVVVVVVIVVVVDVDVVGIFGVGLEPTLRLDVDQVSVDSHGWRKKGVGDFFCATS